MTRTKWAGLLVAGAALASTLTMAPSAVAGQSEVEAKANTVTLWADTNIRAGTSTGTKVVGTAKKGTHAANCQRKGGRVTVGQWTNVWWVWLADRGGYVTAVYVQGGNNDEKIKGIPDCQ